ncbi:MAG: GNAT family N-acetyltransferase [Acidobacteriota bacterium]|nr:GNAT family N-acetyltransferase [Acidobacteriota bacterium]MDH3529396.1 GNAT family N-acetyltransferase [Acidobacteriota bacterium]
MKIIEDNLEGPEIAELLTVHLKHAYEHSPPESVHALGLESLKSKEITFWSCWDGTELIGCGALKELNERHGEIKSMRTAEAHLRKGVAAKILEHIIEVARKRGYTTLFLETGSMDAYIPAQKLYLRFGFEFCGPFEGYIEDSNSVFMKRRV